MNFKGAALESLCNLAGYGSDGEKVQLFE